MEASVDTPSTRYAVRTFIVLLGVPVGIFAVTVFWTLKVGVAQPGWGLHLAAYVAGTLPGLIVGARYPASATAKTAFVVTYLLVCAGLLFVESLLIGCWLTNVCL